jgi:histidinol-phosphate aminotransferase
LRGWTEELAAQLRGMGISTYPTRTYFFLADLAPHDAKVVAAKLSSRGMLIRPLNDPVLGSGFMRITTAQPADNIRFIHAIREVLSHA